MSSLNDRENAFENKFAHDEEMKFKAEARANKLLGLWAAGLMGEIRRRSSRICQGSDPFRL